MTMGHSPVLRARAQLRAGIAFDGKHEAAELLPPEDARCAAVVLATAYANGLDDRRMSQPSYGPSQRLVATVRGSVQGVGYRWFVQREASRLGLSGWVTNQGDGSVEVVAEGEVGVIEGFVTILGEGPTGAGVTEVVARYEPARGDNGGFEIRSGAHRGD